jgi:DNA-binding CsgD family transcriptional regulator
VVVGDAGSGKSRLVAEVLSRSALAGITVLSGRAREFEADRPVGPLVEALDIRRTADPERSAIARLIARGRRPSDAEARHEIPMLIEALVCRLCASRAIALVLEDLQWADPLSAITIGRLLDRPGGGPVVVVMTMRPFPANAAFEEVLTSTPSHVDRIELEPLGTHEATTLLTSLVGLPTGPRLVELAMAAGGNPGLLVALVRALEQDGALKAIGGTVDTDATLPPRSMRPAVLGRLARLPDSCRDLLSVAAVIGRPFAVRTLATAAGRRTTDLLTDLRWATSAGLVDDRAGLLRFRHELVRETIYEGLSPALRSILHLRVAQALLADGVEASAVAPHLLRGGVIGDEPPVSLESRAEHAEPASPRGWKLLTRAEREVTGLVRQGLTNRQIGERLFVSPRTIETHLSHVFAKLGLTSRVELAGVLGGRTDNGVDDGEKGRPASVRRTGDAKRRMRPAPGEQRAALPKP